MGPSEHFALVEHWGVDLRVSPVWGTVLGIILGLSATSHADDLKDMIRTLGPIDVQVTPVVIEGRVQPVEGDAVYLNGHEIYRTTGKVYVKGAWPDIKQPKWIVLSDWMGAAACDGSEFVVDITASPPSVTASFGYCNGSTRLYASDQIIFDFYDGDVWAYDESGLVKLPKLPLTDAVRLGIDAFKAKEFKRSLQLLWPLRDKSDPQAPYFLGLAYEFGRGVKQDYSQAIEYYSAAADMQYAQAFYRLGLMSAHGKGTLQNPRTARNLFQKGAEIGDGLSAFELAKGLLDHLDDPDSQTEGLKWLLIAQERVVESKELVEIRDRLAKTQASLSSEQQEAAERAYYAYAPSTPALFQEAQDLRAWIGKHPLELIKGTTMLDVPELNVRLRVATGDGRLAEIKALTGPGGVWERDGWLHATICQRACNLNNAEIAVNLETYEVVACSLVEVAGDPSANLVSQITGGSLLPLQSRVIVGEESAQCSPSHEEPGYMLKQRIAALNSAPSTTADIPPSNVNKTPPAAKETQRSGTAYLLNKSGDLLTNHHVVEGCASLTVVRGKQHYAAASKLTDPANDLAVVTANVPDLLPVRFRDGKGIRPADSVVALGFPYAGLLANKPQVSTGTVTALAGIQDDSRFLQISNPIQPGNSGGPLLDLSGNVVGTVVSTLDAIAIAEATGSVPQNVNFAIKSSVVRNFLDANGVDYETRLSNSTLDAADVSELAAKSVILLECITSQ